ncbi:MAG: 1,4-dihydroxy-6-naphthoate synthase, partial [Rikenella sp.]|nr:1,4-dihydroxy-6-naphthoate synthase [Rikenella sp.]
MKLHISPCPNDTFTFHALIHGLVDTEGLRFEPVFDDIDALNRAAIEAPDEEQIVKISYA